MNKFIKYITIRLFIITGLAFIFDFVYTATYTSNKEIRNKIQFIFQNKNTNYDYIFLGSSKVEFGINTTLLNKSLGIKSLNMGISGQNLSQTVLTLKLLNDNNIKAKKYFIQIDENINVEDKKSLLGESYFMPFIQNEHIKSYLRTKDENFLYDYYLPFYRYINYGYKIGYREFFLSLYKKKRKAGFFIPQNKTMNSKNNSIKFKKEYQIDTLLLNDLNEFAKKNQLNITFFSMPIYNAVNTTVFKKKSKYLNIQQYIDSIPNHLNFKDPLHLNKNGADEFTKMLIRDYNL